MTGTTAISKHGVVYDMPMHRQMQYTNIDIKSVKYIIWGTAHDLY